MLEAKDKITVSWTPHPVPYVANTQTGDRWLLPHLMQVHSFQVHKAISVADTVTVRQQVTALSSTMLPLLPAFMVHLIRLFCLTLGLAFPCLKSSDAKSWALEKKAGAHCFLYTCRLSVPTYDAHQASPIKMFILKP